MSTQKKRSYDSASRLAKVAQTRERILAVAKTLFAKHGIDNVTIDQLATGAEVSAPTVFAQFQSKQGILRALANDTLFDDRYETLVRKAQSITEPVERLAVVAAIARNTYDVEKSKMGLLRGASAFSPELKELEREGEQRRYHRQESTIRLFIDNHALAPGLDRARARDVLWALTSRDIYRMLVVEKGWSSDAYEQWLADTLRNALVKR